MLVLPIVAHVYSLLRFATHHALFSLTALCFLAFICIATYNRYFHPLHKFPGPFWGSITDFYNTYLFSTRKVHLKLLALHEHYGLLPIWYTDTIQGPN